MFPWGRETGSEGMGRLGGWDQAGRWGVWSRPPNSHHRCAWSQAHLPGLCGTLARASASARDSHAEHEDSGDVSGIACVEVPVLGPGCSRLLVAVTRRVTAGLPSPSAEQLSVAMATRLPVGGLILELGPPSSGFVPRPTWGPLSCPWCPGQVRRAGGCRELHWASAPLCLPPKSGPAGGAGLPPPQASLAFPASVSRRMNRR